ncbi:putative conidiation-specific expression protein [Neurospora tetraspora]|uniref:Conidiation-specific expression protein n=1 Tax=Neurospora tetraspora TaxID=94610 RepID=A0AAE0MXS6_9PEZI|nr:putative conidiation-specific expression protein [Neurospora tetraspora]
MDDTNTTTGTNTNVGPLPPTTAPRNPPSSDTAPPASESTRTPVAPVSGGARTSTAAAPASESTGKTGTDPAQSMSKMGTGARDTSDSKLIDDSTKLFPSVGGTMSSGEGEAQNMFRSERSASTSSTSSTVSGSDRLMGSASTVTEFPHARRASHHGLFEGLIDQKRRNDPASVARRQSLSEQRPSGGGFIAKMWDNWVRGAPPDI